MRVCAVPAEAELLLVAPQDRWPCPHHRLGQHVVEDHHLGREGGRGRGRGREGEGGREGGGCREGEEEGGRGGRREKEGREEEGRGGASLTQHTTASRSHSQASCEAWNMDYNKSDGC